MIDLEDYDYELPKELIRKIPLEKRDESRLFVYNTKTDEVVFDIFKNLANHIKERSVLVRNVTQVLPVRLHVHKETGGKLEVFLLMNEYKGTETIPAIVNRKLVVGGKVYLDKKYFFEVVDQDEGTFFLKPSFDISILNQVLLKYGTTPVPHYLEDENQGDEEYLRTRYQSLFANKGASTAAPTASLHFTDDVLESCREKGISTCDTLLNVGLGTFANIDEKTFITNKLHKEYFEVSDTASKELYNAKQFARPVIAIGTTAMRTLESWKHTEEFEEGLGARGDTEIFIYPPYNNFFADGLLTNFHLPKTSLMLLVDAFLKSKNAKKTINDLYDIAIKEKFMFYSFGDAMLIL